MVELKDLFRYTPDVLSPALVAATESGDYDGVISNPASDIYTFPLFTRGYCEALIGLCDATGRFTPAKGATYSVPELRLTTVSKLLMESYIAVVRRHVLPAIEAVWEVGDHFDVFRVPFLCRYSMDTIQSMGRHHDAHAVVSLTVNLNDAFEGGSVYFNRQDYNTRSAPVGHCVMFPSMVTHEHEALPITSGTRYSMTCWLSSTKADTRADDSWVIRAGE